MWWKRLSAKLAVRHWLIFLCLRFGIGNAIDFSDVGRLFFCGRKKEFTVDNGVAIKQGVASCNVITPRLFQRPPSTHRHRDHNVCSSQPTDPLSNLLTCRITD